MPADGVGTAHIALPLELEEVYNRSISFPIRSVKPFLLLGRVRLLNLGVKSVKFGYFKACEGLENRRFPEQPLVVKQESSPDDKPAHTKINLANIHAYPNLISR